MGLTQKEGTANIGRDDNDHYLRIPDYLLINNLP